MAMQRSVMAVCLVAAAVFSGCNSSRDGHRYPHGTVTIICPWAAGGGTDQVSRAMAMGLQQYFDSSFIVVNRTGGSGATGHREGARSRPDGHTLTMITFELSTMHHMGISPLSYQDFQPLIQLNADPAAIVVHKDAPWKTLTELLDQVKNSPGKLTISGTSTGGAWDLARAGMLQAAGLPVNSMVWVPNKGSAPSLVELLGRHIDVVCCSVPEVSSHLESEQVRVLGVMAETRLERFPEIPTMREQKVDWVAIGWRGLAVPKETPKEIVNQLLTACQAVVASEPFQTQMQKTGFGVQIRATDEFTEYLREQDELWKPVIEAAGYAKS